MQNTQDSITQPQVSFDSNFIYDLHSHTRASDGVLEPQELIMRAEVRQIGALAITDHDTTGALASAKSYIDEQKCKLKLVNGIEISTKWHGFEIHIVGLCIDPDAPIFADSMAIQRKHRALRAQAVGEKLAKKGIENAYEEAKLLAGSDLVSRTHFAKVLLKRGIVSNFDAAFKKYLGKGKACYVSPSWMDIETAVRIINSANGLAVLAHPIRYDLSNKWLTKLIEHFAHSGGHAIEVGLSQMSPNQRTHLSRLAAQYDLYSSQGSDFHAPTKWGDLGKNLRLTDNCRPIWTHPKWRFA